MTQETRSDESGRQSLGARIGSGRFPIRAKLVAVLLLPVTLLVGLGVYQVLTVQQSAREAEDEAELADAVTGPGSFLDLVIDERNHTAVYLLGAEDLISSVEPGQYLEDRELVDEARQEFLDKLADEEEQVQEIYQPAVDAISQLDELRARVDGDESTRDFQNVEAVQDLFDRFSEVTDPLFDANRQVSLTVTDPTLQRGTAIVDQALRQSDTIALLTYRLVVASLAGDADGVNTPDEYITISTLLRDLRAGEQTIRLNGQEGYAEYTEALFAAEHTGEFPELVEEALRGGATDVGGLFGSAGNEDAFGYDDLREAAEAEISDSVESVSGNASRTQNYFTFGGLAVLLVLGIVTSLVAWSITRPLRSLTRQAMGMAGHRLPNAVQSILEAPPGEDVDVPRLAPIEIHTRDEVADVARALNTVQDSALDLAVEQAALRRNISDSFVYLGRRNQSLLGRQLDFITELEQGETDPAALANLFRLDHLATRMRRNAESLLVLAGIEPPRTWRVPVPLTDVIRAALGEVEDYQRVAIRGVESASIVGSAAADLAHLLAELIENALAFSPPHQPVEIRGRYRPTLPSALTTSRPSPGTDDGAFTLTVVDSGVGMSEQDLVAANRRLAGEESFTVAPSKYLGHYVAGMIARRHGIHVRLDGVTHKGVTATLTLPANLLTDQPAGSSTAAPGSWQPSQTAETSAAAGATVPTGQSPSVDRALHPGGRAAPQQDTYRVGDNEFQIDFGTSQPAPQPATQPAVSPFAPPAEQQGQPIRQGQPVLGHPYHQPAQTRAAPPARGPQVPGTPQAPGVPPAPGSQPAAAERAQTAEWAIPAGPGRGQQPQAPLPPPGAPQPHAPQHLRTRQPQSQSPQPPQPRSGGPQVPPGGGSGDAGDDAHRARNVRDALSSLSVGLQRGRAAARERDDEDGDSEPGGAGRTGEDPGTGGYGWEERGWT